eukprot:gene29196-35241_t
MDDEEWDDFTSSPVPNKVESTMENVVMGSELPSGSGLEIDDLDRFLDAQIINQPQTEAEEEIWDDFASPAGGHTVSHSLLEEDFSEPASSSLTAVPNQPLSAIDQDEYVHIDTQEVSGTTFLPDQALSVAVGRNDDSISLPNSVDPTPAEINDTSAVTIVEGLSDDVVSDKHSNFYPEVLSISTNESVTLPPGEVNLDSPHALARAECADTGDRNTQEGATGFDKATDETTDVPFPNSASGFVDVVIEEKKTVSDDAVLDNFTSTSEHSVMPEEITVDKDENNNSAIIGGEAAGDKAAVAGNYEEMVFSDDAVVSAEDVSVETSNDINIEITNRDKGADDNLLAASEGVGASVDGVSIVSGDEINVVEEAENVALSADTGMGMDENAHGNSVGEGMGEEIEVQGEAESGHVQEESDVWNAHGLMDGPVNVEVEETGVADEGLEQQHYQQEQEEDEWDAFTGAEEDTPVQVSVQAADASQGSEVAVEEQQGHEAAVDEPGVDKEEEEDWDAFVAPVSAPQEQDQALVSGGAGGDLGDGQGEVKEQQDIAWAEEEDGDWADFASPVIPDQSPTDAHVDDTLHTSANQTTSAPANVAQEAAEEDDWDAFEEAPAPAATTTPAPISAAPAPLPAHKPLPSLSLPSEYVSWFLQPSAHAQGDATQRAAAILTEVLGMREKLGDLVPLTTTPSPSPPCPLPPLFAPTAPSTGGSDGASVVWPYKHPSTYTYTCTYTTAPSSSSCAMPLLSLHYTRTYLQWRKGKRVTMSSDAGVESEEDERADVDEFEAFAQADQPEQTSGKQAEAVKTSTVAKDQDVQDDWGDDEDDDAFTEFTSAVPLPSTTTSGGETTPPVDIPPPAKLLAAANSSNSAAVGAAKTQSKSLQANEGLSRAAQQFLDSLPDLSFVLA